MNSILNFSTIGFGIKIWCSSTGEDYLLFKGANITIEILFMTLDEYL
jgi:hypothetical protein